MYDYDYEADILLVLRLLKFLKEQDPQAAANMTKLYEEWGLDELYELPEIILWEIFDDVTFDEDPEFETSIVTFSHPVFDRLCELGQQLEALRGRIAGGWQRKIQDILEFFACGASYSVDCLQMRFIGGKGTVDIHFSGNCYEPVYFANSLVDALLYCKRECLRLEEMIKDLKQNRETE